MPEINKILFREFVHGATKIFENAEALFKEASILEKDGHLSRALFLHQISLEECGKIELLGAYAVNLLTGENIDISKIKKVLSSHLRKNRANAYFLEASSEEVKATQRGDIKTAINIFSGMQEQFHLKANTAKNASLYVDFKNETFVSPNECITPEMIAEITKLNKEHLVMSFHKVEMLSKWEKNPQRFSESFVQFEKRLKQIKSEQPEDPMKAMTLLIQEMFKEMKP